MHGGRGPPHYLRARDLGDIDVVERGLSIGQRHRDAVQHHAHAAHAELRSRSEPSDGDPLAKRIVEAVVHLDAGDARKRFIECQSRPTALDVVTGSDADGVWCARQVDGGSYNRDDCRRQIGSVATRGICLCLECTGRDYQEGEVLWHAQNVLRDMALGSRLSALGSRLSALGGRPVPRAEGRELSASCAIAMPREQPGHEAPIRRPSSTRSRARDRGPA